MSLDVDSPVGLDGAGDLVMIASVGEIAFLKRGSIARPTPGVIDLTGQSISTLAESTRRAGARVQPPPSR